jgi:5-methylthioribose kinase
LFLTETGVFAAGTPLHIEFLSGGVSSVVVRAVAPEGQCVVVKQALPRLRVEQEWKSRTERSLIEAACGRVLGELVPGSVPAIVRVDPSRPAFVMACAPHDAETWKARLMRGFVQPELAPRVGALLGRIHHRSAARRKELESRFDDRSFFDELRLDPYLRAVARVHPDLADRVLPLVDDLLEIRRCLVHGDFSPKNLLVSGDGAILLVDHEVAHWGNPAFDLAFVLNHLCLKSIKFPEHGLALIAMAHRLVAAYLEEDPPMEGLGNFSVRLLGALMLARVDGKSPVEYLVVDDEKEQVRTVGAALLCSAEPRLDDALEMVLAVAGHVQR